MRISDWSSDVCSSDLRIICPNAAGITVCALHYINLEGFYTKRQKVPDGGRMFEGFDHQTVKVGDIEVAYAIGGTGPALLLLHGYPQNRFMWATVAALLADRFTAVCGNLRGYGVQYTQVTAADQLP